MIKSKTFEFIEFINTRVFLNSNYSRQRRLFSNDSDEESRLKLLSFIFIFKIEFFVQFHKTLNFLLIHLFFARKIQLGHEMSDYMKDH